MKIYADQFTSSEIYQLMTSEERRPYQVMPTWDILLNKLSKLALSDTTFDYIKPVERMIIAKSFSEINHVDVFIFIDSTKFLKDLKEHDSTTPMVNFVTSSYVKEMSKTLLGTWRKAKCEDTHITIDKMILIDNGVILPEESIEDLRLCMLIYENYYGTTNDISIEFSSTSFHQSVKQKFYFGEEFREFLDSSDVDVDDAIIGYTTCLIPLYIIDVFYRGGIEEFIYETVSEVMQDIDNN